MSLDHRSPAYLDEEYPISINITNADSQELDIVADVLLQPTEIDHAGLYWLIVLFFSADKIPQSTASFWVTNVRLA
jgi:hypothetical protein